MFRGLACHASSAKLGVWCVFSVDMMGHPELKAECDVTQLGPLLSQDVVDELLSKYIQTFTVSAHQSRFRIRPALCYCCISVACVYSHS